MSIISLVRRRTGLPHFPPRVHLTHLFHHTCQRKVVCTICIGEKTVLVGVENDITVFYTSHAEIQTFMP